MDVEKLVHALDNDENEHLCNLTTKIITQLKLDVLNEMELTRDTILDYMKKLKLYKFIDELNELKYGAFIRWIPLSDPDNLYLTAGGIICDIKITDTGISIICKNFANKYYQIKFDECHIFQKLTGQEQLILKALDHLAK
jgi:hypothetical protein